MISDDIKIYEDDQMTCSSQAVSTNMTWCPCQSCVAHLSTSSWWRSSRTRRMSRHRPGAVAPSWSGSTPTAASGRWLQTASPRWEWMTLFFFLVFVRSCFSSCEYHVVCFVFPLSLQSFLAWRSHGKLLPLVPGILLLSPFFCLNFFWVLNWVACESIW